MSPAEQGNAHVSDFLTPDEVVTEKDLVSRLALLPDVANTDAPGLHLAVLTPVSRVRCQAERSRSVWHSAAAP
jgi:hypothetical protein